MAGRVGSCSAGIRVAGALLPEVRPGASAPVEEVASILVGTVRLHSGHNRHIPGHRAGHRWRLLQSRQGNGVLFSTFGQKQFDCRQFQQQNDFFDTLIVVVIDFR